MKIRVECPCGCSFETDEWDDGCCPSCKTKYYWFEEQTLDSCSVTVWFDERKTWEN